MIPYKGKSWILKEKRCPFCNRFLKEVGILCIIKENIEKFYKLWEKPSEENIVRNGSFFSEEFHCGYCGARLELREEDILNFWKGLHEKEGGEK